MIEITSEVLNSIRLRCEARMPFQSSEVLSLIAEVERLRAERQWRPMETAPKKGEILIALTHGIVIAEWCLAEQKWLFVSESLTDRDSADIDFALEDDQCLLGWMPLPKPPEQKL